MLSHKTTVSVCPIVLKHDFPNESQNYLDEKMDEGQYKKRFRYDRPIAQNKSGRPQTAQNHVILKSMNFLENHHEYGFRRSLLEATGLQEGKEIGKICHKTKKKTEHIQSTLSVVYGQTIKGGPGQQNKSNIKSNPSQQEQENVRLNFKENDLCMLAYSGALEFIARQNIILDQKKPAKTPTSSIPRVKSSFIKTHDLNLQVENQNYNLEVEGTAYNLPYNQYATQSKIRPASSYTTIRPQSSTKNGSEGGHQTSQENYGGIRNLLVEQVEEEDENNDVANNMMRVASSTFLSPSASEHLYPLQLGVRGSKAPKGFMHKGPLRVQSAFGQTQGSFNTNEPKRVHHSQRPKTSYQYVGAGKQFVQSVRQMNHLDVIQEMKRQDDLQVKNKELSHKVNEEREKLAVFGNHMQVSEKKDMFYVNYVNFIKNSLNAQAENVNTQKILDDILQDCNTNQMGQAERPMTASRNKSQGEKLKRIHSSSNHPVSLINIDGSNFNNQSKPIHQDQYQQF